MRVRLVPFANVSERLYRVARQTAKELDKRVNVDVRGGTTEIDRGVLEKMVGPFEHLIRNAIVHGLELPAERRSAGKAETGELVLDVRQEANEIVVVLSDDGAGLNLERIRQRAIERDLIGAEATLGDRELMDLIFLPGFSTATEVTELAGRGVGMDVVRAELSSFGGRIAVSSETGRGTRFTLYLPMTLAVAQVVLARIGTRRYALPAGMVEQVRRYRPVVLLPSLAEGMIDIPPVGAVVLRPLSQLVGEETTGHLSKQTPVILLRSGDDHMAIAVDDVSSNQEVVVKNVGKQVARLAGILGATILGNGEIVLIINPVQLIARAPEPPAIFEEELRAEAKLAPTRAEPPTEIGVASVPTVMVVDDSLTVRARYTAAARAQQFQRAAGQGWRRRPAATAGREARRHAGRHRDAPHGRLRPDPQHPQFAHDVAHPDHHDHLAHGREASQHGVRTRRQRVPRKALSGGRVAEAGAAVHRGAGDGVVAAIGRSFALRGLVYRGTTDPAGSRPAASDFLCFAKESHQRNATARDGGLRLPLRCRASAGRARNSPDHAARATGSDTRPARSPLPPRTAAASPSGLTPSP